MKYKKPPVRTVIYNDLYHALFLFFRLRNKMPYIVLTEEDLVKNVKQTSSYKPIGHQSWKDFWMCNTGQEWPQKCRIKGCTKPAFGGGHVYVDGYSYFDFFIIPLCRSCNCAQNTNWMSVNVRTAAAVVDEDQATGNEGASSNYQIVSEELEILATFIKRQWYIKNLMNNFYY